MFNWFWKLLGIPTTTPHPVNAPVSTTVKEEEELTTESIALPAKVEEPTEELEEKKIDKEVFFAELRAGIFRSGLKITQVKGIEALLDEMYGQPTSWIAYALATAYHETKKSMKPNTESLNYSVQGLLNTFGRHRISAEDANRLGRKPGEGALPVTRQRAIANIIYGGEWGKKNLGNTEADDGWKYRGRGMDHCTGRRNYRLTGNDIDVDLITKPELLLQLPNAVKALHLGMTTGRYVPGNSFSTYLPSVGNATRQQFRNARRIINGTDKAELIADYALAFQEALNKAGYKD